MITITALIAVMGLLNRQMPNNANVIADANNRFGVKLAQRIGENQANLLVSPISLSSNLMLLLAGSRGETRNTLAKTLELAELKNKQVAAGSSELDHLLTGPGKSDVAIANSIWIAPGISILPTYSALASGSFRATTEPLSATGTAGADLINEWISDHTKQRIKTLFRTIPADAVLVLANAIAFDGKWQAPFSARDTWPRVFHGVEGDSQVRTMSAVHDYESATIGDSQIIRLAYVGGASLWIALPKLGENPDSLLDSLLIPPQTSTARARLFLPKFAFEDQHDLRTALSQLGMATLFQHADFSGISANPRLGKISEIAQKTYIKVDEQGTEAAAATGTMISPTAIFRQPAVPEIHIDRPFALAIRDDATGTLLFIGIVRNLKQ